MIRTLRGVLVSIASFAVLGAALVAAPGCATKPDVDDRPAFIHESRAATQWFKDNVRGLEAQLSQSAGYAVFPSVGQWGIIITGGKFGRGMLNRPNGSQMGWAAVSTGSLGLQAGVQGFKMLIVFEDEATLQGFKENTLEGSASAVAVAGDAGGSTTSPFYNGIAVYQGANAGLMAGVNIGLDYLRYEPIDQ